MEVLPHGVGDEDDADGAVVGRPGRIEVLLAEVHDLFFQPGLDELGSHGLDRDRLTTPERQWSSAPARLWSHIWDRRRT